MNKRTNPFDRKTVDKEISTPNVETTQQIDVSNQEQVNLEQNYQHQPTQQPQTQPQNNVYYQNYQQPAYQPNYDVRYNVPRRAAENNKEKYTATMDRNLRTQIKIACATKGIMFSQFIEDACREKLQREGARK